MDSIRVLGIWACRPSVLPALCCSRSTGLGAVRIGADIPLSKIWCGMATAKIGRWAPGRHEEHNIWSYKWFRLAAGRWTWTRGATRTRSSCWPASAGGRSWRSTRPSMTWSRPLSACERLLASLPGRRSSAHAVASDTECEKLATRRRERSRSISANISCAHRNSPALHMKGGVGFMSELLNPNPNPGPN